MRDLVLIACDSSLARLSSAALQLPPDAAGRDPLGDVPKRLEIGHFSGIDAGQLGPAAETLLRRQLPHRHALSYLPGLGTELAKNSRALTVIPGADFASHVLRDVLFETITDSGLRAALRGGVPERAWN